MGTPSRFISADWGTSNFRLRLIDSKTRSTLSELKTDRGIRQCFADFQNQNELSQERFFGDYLSSQVRQLKGLEDSQTIVLSGMASANIGLRELPYATLPIKASGESLRSEEITLSSLPNRCLLVSGVRESKDVMRGEEIQAVGLADHLPTDGEAILLLPGTHSKHLSYAFGEFKAFSTFMTGEVFEVLSQHTVLSNSLQAKAWEDRFHAPFINGVRAGSAGQLTRELFGLRAGSILSSADPSDNHFQLSGMLIGDELRALVNSPRPVYLAASQPLDTLYRMALEALVDNSRIHIIPPVEVAQALIQAHSKILMHHD